MKQEQAKQLYDIWNGDIKIFVEDVLPHHLTNAMPEFHKEIYDFLQREQRVCLAAPRGFAKSMLCSVFYPLHAALFAKKKDILIISASEGLAIEWLRKIRFEIENNELLISLFGNLKSDKWTETHLILNNSLGTNIRARGAGGQIRGFRPDLIIVDDIETDDSVASSEQRDKLRNWIFKSCLNTLLPHGQFIWIGTIISPLALINEQLEGDNGWIKRKYQAYKDAIQEEGYELWGDLWTHEKLQQRKKEIGSFAFASEFLNDPISDETAPIKQHQIKNWVELPKQYSCVIAVDPAYSEEAKADYKVAVLVAIDQNHNRYLISYIRTHAPSGEFIDGVLNMYLQNKDRLTGLGVPCSGTEREFFRSFSNKAADRGMFPPIVELKNVFKTGTDRVIRRKRDRIIAALQPLFENGKYYIHANHTEAKDELLSIGASRHDDLTDAMTYAETILSPIYTEPPTAEYGRYGELLDEEKEESNYRGAYDYGY